jgi:hypothetical protein
MVNKEKVLYVVNKLMDWHLDIGGNSMMFTPDEDLVSLDEVYLYIKNNLN